VKAGINPKRHFLPMLYKEAFLSYLRFEKRYSEHTIKSYDNDLSQFRIFCDLSGARDPEFDSVIIRLWVVSLLEDGMSPRTIHRKISSLRSYARFLLREGHIKTNPLDKVLKPKMNKGIPLFIEEENLNHFLDTYQFSTDFKGIRDRLIIELLYQTGIRRSELIGLTRQSVDIGSHQLKVMGKRNKERVVPFGNDLAKLMNEYIEKRGHEFPDCQEASLLLTDTGMPVYPKLVYRVVNRFLQLVTTLGQKSPHILRHTFATHLLNQGADLNAIKELLGHANLGATQVYTHNSFEKLKEVYNKAHPRAD